jgi:hypothetical protein
MEVAFMASRGFMRRAARKRALVALRVVGRVEEGVCSAAGRQYVYALPGQRTSFGLEVRHSGDEDDPAVGAIVFHVALAARRGCRCPRWQDRQ